jgi:predicted Zn-dependent peptidase
LKPLLLTLLIGILSQISAQNQKLKLPIEKHILPNGMKVLFYTDSQSPTVACRLFYTTGSVHERAGNSGIAHMLEHMLFKGTKKVGIKDTIQDKKYLELIDQQIALAQNAKAAKDSIAYKRHWANYDSLLTEHRKIMVTDELWETYLRHGGTGLNAFTSSLMTAYFVTLPKNKAELFLWFEADRMQNAVLREFYPERDVVREERRMRYDDSPYGRYFESMDGVFYEAHPYRVPTIGWPSDIANYTREKAKEHYRKYYKPNNAILILAGDFDTKDMLNKIKSYFEPIPAGEDFSPVTIIEPDQVAAKRLNLIKADAKPRLDLWFHTPEFGHPDIYALDVLEGALNGQSGLLYKELVQKQKLVLSAGAGNSINKYISSFEFALTLKPDSDVEVVEKALWDQIEKMKTEPLSEYQLQKVKNKVAATLVRSFENKEHVANLLAYYEIFGNWKLLLSFSEEVAKVTAEDVQRVAKKYLQKKLSTTGTVLPPKEGVSK